MQKPSQTSLLRSFWGFRWTAVGMRLKLTCTDSLLST